MPSDKPVLFIKGIEPTTHAAFKAWCARRGKTMTAVVVKIIEDLIMMDDDLLDIKVNPVSYARTKQNTNRKLRRLKSK